MRSDDEKEVEDKKPTGLLVKKHAFIIESDSEDEDDGGMLYLNSHSLSDVPKPVPGSSKFFFGAFPELKNFQRNYTSEKVLVKVQNFDFHQLWSYFYYWKTNVYTKIKKSVDVAL